jgi:quercetin dioxygenase-like cupin family protein
MDRRSLACLLISTGFLTACSHTPASRRADPDSGTTPLGGGHPAILARGEGEHRLMQGRRPVYVLVDSVTVGSPTLVAGLSEMAPGDSIPVHKHLGEEEIVFVHRGTVEVTLGEETHKASAGATVFVPRGTWVGVRVAGTDTATILFVFNAPSYEKCLRAQSSRPGEQYVPPSAQALEAVRRDCHYARKGE